MMERAKSGKTSQLRQACDGVMSESPVLLYTRALTSYLPNYIGVVDHALEVHERDWYER